MVKKAIINSNLERGGKVMSNDNNTGRVDLATLTIVFITLKLTGNIDWSWWWVLSPT
jgi:hypothetical protein